MIQTPKNNAKDWKAHVRAFFKSRPQREFYLTEIPLAILADVDAGTDWLAGMASAALPSHPQKPQVAAGQTSLTCIIRRADPKAGRPLPLVYLLDAGAPAPPKGAPAGAEEEFCRRIWGLAQVAEAWRVPLIQVLIDPNLFGQAIATLEAGWSAQDAA